MAEALCWCWQQWISTATVALGSILSIWAMWPFGVKKKKADGWRWLWILDSQDHGDWRRPMVFAPAVEVWLGGDNGLL